ncbi:MAG: T9SS type A sorting domain-containing protein [Bacteroidetes bacterium]|nr:T9SS type A sorting domain-containing protein [Bacteroidota bacterium]
MRTTTHIFLAISILFGGWVFGQTNSTFKTREIGINSSEAIHYNLLTTISETHVGETQIKEATYLNINPEQLSLAYANKSEVMEFTIPNGTKNVTLVAMQSKVFTDDASIKDEFRNIVNVEMPIAYRGFVKENPSQMVSFILTNTMITGSIFTHDGNLSFGPLNNTLSNSIYILYNEKQLNDQGVGCNVDDSDWDDADLDDFNEKLKAGINPKSNKCVTVGAEVDTDLRWLFPNNQACFNFVFASFNQVCYLFENEGIGVFVNDLVIWTSTSPYVGSNSGAYLISFKNEKTSLNSNVYMLMSAKKSFGGQAFIDQLCGSMPYSFCGMDASYSAAPSYSNTIMVMAHELGHLFGSRHTHNCAWPGGAIDNCAPQEGSCAVGPLPTDGGTIMSYCHLTNSGINFNLGFGLLPGSKIRSVIADNSCVLSCNNISALGIEENRGEESFGLYPNPSNGILNISSEYFITKGTQVSIVQYDGRLVINKEIDLQKGIIQLDLSELRCGTYFVVLSNPQGKKATLKWTKLN